MLNDKLLKAWNDKHAELSLDKRNALAGICSGWQGSGYKENSKRILLLGKATDGKFDSVNANEAAFGCKPTAFWSFARRLNGLTGIKDGELENIAWSNICKIGSAHGNPSKRLLNAQSALAAETLRHEFEHLKPTVVVCVAEGYAEEIIYRALDATKGGEGDLIEKRCGGYFFYVRAAKGPYPAFVWMRHPQGKKQEYLEASEKVIREMLAA